MISDDSITALILDAEIMVELAHSAAPGGRSPGLQGEALASDPSVVPTTDTLMTPSRLYDDCDATNERGY